MLGTRITKLFAASGNITAALVTYYDQFVAQTAGICLTLPAATRSLVNKHFRVINSSAGPVALALNSGESLVSGATAVAIPSYGLAEVRCVEVSTGSYKFMIDGVDIAAKGTFTPVATWAGSAPTEGTHYGEYFFVDGACFIRGTLNVTDGGGSTGLSSFTGLPFVPKDVDTFVPIEMHITVDGTVTKCKAYIECADAASANRIVTVNSSATLTDDKVCKVEFSGFYEVAGFEAYVPTQTYGTATPGSPAVVCRWKKLGKAGVMYFGLTSADSNAVSSAKIDFPFPIPDNNSYTAICALEKAGAGGATWYQPIGYVDQTDNTAANRAANFRAFTTATDGQAFGLWFAAVAECEPWTTFTHTVSWGGTAPASYATVGKFAIYGGLCFVSIWGHSTDGNAATSYAGNLPMPCYYSANVKHCLSGYQLVNTTYTECAPLVANNVAAHSSRTVGVAKFATVSDGNALDFCFGGWFPVG